MLQSGIPLLEGIRLCRASVKNQLYRKLFDQLEDSVLNGEGIGVILSSTTFVPPGASQMVATAERTGRLGPVMVTIGEFYENEGEQKIRNLVQLLEPLIIVVMGAVVSVVVLAVMLPLLDVTTGSH
jgi:type II secretory pathway component PulF